MGKTLREIAEQLRDSKKKVQLIYAFNGTGKTRLSREFKQLVAPKVDDVGAGADVSQAPSWSKILYYSAFTEDLFYWDNDLALDAHPRIRIQPNSFTDWLLRLLRDLGQDGNIVSHFQRYSNEKLTPHFSEGLDEVTFFLQRGDDAVSGNLKISRSEENSLIWSIFYTLMDQAILVLNQAETEYRETKEFDLLEYVFIDDPVSSVDENHLIELAVDLGGVLRGCDSGLKFIIATHNPLFYNVLYNELKVDCGYFLERFDDGTFELLDKRGDSNRGFSYHLHIKKVIEQAVHDNKIERYHFTLLRNLYEKTASFLGYKQWSDLLPQDRATYFNRIIQFTSHSTLSNEALADPSPQEKQTVRFLLNHLVDTYGYRRYKDDKNV